MRKLFIDTANLEDIIDAFELGVLSGVTTNPSLLAKEPKTDFYQHIKNIVEICKINSNAPLSVEVFATQPEEIKRQAYNLVDKFNYDNLNIKIPIGHSELKVIKELADNGVNINCTCCFTSTQMQLAALSGSRYVSLFYNRLIDANGNPTTVLKQVRDFIDSNSLNCEIIAGSIRNSEDVSSAWYAGCDIVTASHKIISSMSKHESTDKSVAQFLNDFESWIS